MRRYMEGGGARLSLAAPPFTSCAHRATDGCVRTTSLLQASVIHRTNRDELRALCQDRGCYDKDNFTSYFRNSLFRELGEKGARARTYRLSNKGLEEAKVLLKAMAEGEPHGHGFVLVRARTRHLVRACVPT